MQEFSQYLTKAGSISPNAPLAIRADYFVYRAKKVHGSKYSYDPSVFTSTKIKTQITCPEHGVFEQTPALHLAGRGCPKCNAGSSGKDPSTAIKELVEKFPNLDFSASTYTGSLKDISFYCPIHGNQIRQYHSILKSTGSGCILCSRIKRSTKESVLDKLQYLHEDKYEYGYLPSTLSGKEHVTIICKEHGEFSQLLRKHLEGQGCPACAYRNSDVLYLLKHPTEPIFKIGVTSKHRISQRLYANRKASNIELLEVKWVYTSNAQIFEKELLEKYTNNPYLDEGFVGYTEYRKLTEKELQEILSYMESIS